MPARYYRELLSFLARSLKDRDAAADLAQESYARLFAVQRSGEAVSDPRALLYRTARNLIIDEHRRAKVRDHEDIDRVPEDALPAAPRHQQPDEALASLQVVRAYVATIEALPVRCREAFVLSVFDELTHAQIADRMGISVSMVEKHVARGMIACKLCERRLRAPPSAGDDARR